MRRECRWDWTTEEEGKDGKEVGGGGGLVMIIMQSSFFFNLCYFNLKTCHQSSKFRMAATKNHVVHYEWKFSLNNYTHSPA